MPSFLRRWWPVLAVCALALLYFGGSELHGTQVALARSGTTRHHGNRSHHSRSPGARSSRRRSQNVWSVDARDGVRELLGGDGSAVGWSPAIAEWGGTVGPHWWQSALAMLTLMHYAERADDRSQLLQHVIWVTYKRNVWKPRSLEKFDFINQYMDDTVWWGIAWLNASEYELYYRQNVALAAKFLKVAEKDASYVAARRQCGGIIWELGSPAGTITNAEYVALTAELAQYRRTSSKFHNPGLALRWLSAAEGTLSWLQRAGLVNLGMGTVKDRLGAGACHTILGGPLAYTEGEVADALVQLGNALNEPSYYRLARRFLRYVLYPGHGFLAHGVLEEHCEAVNECNGSPNRYDITAFKGIFVQAVADFSQATGSNEFQPFLRTQGESVIHRALVSGAPDGVCMSAHACRFAFSWTLPYQHTPGSERLITVGTQESALVPLIALLP